MSYRRHLFFGNLIFIANIVLVLIVFGFAYFLFHLQQTTFQGDGELYLSETYKKANLQIDATKITGKIKPIWEAFAQGGEEQNVNMLAGTEVSMQKINPQYIRIDHIFDDDYYGVVKGSGNNLSLDWTKLDQTVASITQMGAKPFFSLGYMPASLAASKIDIPYDWNKWQWLVGQCIQHYSGVEGKGISQVYYEVWNEPDLESFGKWHYSGSKNYLTLYRYAAQAAQTARQNNNIKQFYIGGPAITATYENWIHALVEYTQENNLPLDFVSWHRYSYDDNLFLKDVISLRNWLANKGQFQLIISEFGPDSEKSSIYYSPTSEAHVVSATRQLLESGLDWLYAFEVKDDPNQGSQGWGLLTHNQANLYPKPRYRSYLMMKSMFGDRLLLQGEGSNVKAWAVKKDDEIMAIVSNYNPSFSQTESVPVQINNLVPGNYIVIWETLKGEGGEEKYQVGENRTYIHTFELSSGNVLHFRIKKLP